MSDDLEEFLLLLSKTPPTPTPRITTNGGSRTNNVPSSILADLELEEEPDVKVRGNSDLFLLSMMHRDKDEEEPVRNCYDPPKSTVLGTLDRKHQPPASMAARTLLVVPVEPPSASGTWRWSLSSRNDTPWRRSPSRHPGRSAGVTQR